MHRAIASAASSFETIFKMSDDDRDGKLSLQEFRKALFQLPAMKSEGALEVDELKEMFLEVKLLSGKLEEFDVIETIEDGTARMTLDEFRTAFDGFDEDDDRAVSKTPETSKADNDAIFDSDDD